MDQVDLVRACRKAPRYSISLRPDDVALAEYLVMKEAIISPGVVSVSPSCDAIFRHFDLCNPAEREEQLDQILRRIFGSLAHDVADCGSYSGVEENASSLQSGKIHAHGLSRLKGSHNSPRVKLCACFPPIANQLAVGILA